MTKPITLYGHGATPNPVKVAIILEELGIPYEVKSIDFKTELKSEPYISINPNGRIPSIEDPNTGVTLFESGAIIEYLVETYDKENKLQYLTSPEKWLTKSWLYFQVSGQGPYFGQYAWFVHFHPEKNITSAIDRYGNEIKRVTGVLNAHLKKEGTPYLLGDKVTYADLAWVPWQKDYASFMTDWDYETELPEFTAWNKRLLERPSVKRVLAHKDFQRH